MQRRKRRRSRITLAVAFMLGACALSDTTAAASDYRPITASMAERTVTLTGADLTVEQVIAVARHGAKVQLSPEARRRGTDAYGLLLEAQAEGVPIYRFNRGAGSGREIVTLEGDPMSPENREKIAKRQLETFQRGAQAGLGPEISEEDVVRAMMVVRANTLTWTAASPPVMQILIDLLNNQITPVVQSRGTLGEGDLAQIGNLEGTMVGKGEAYFHGVRMPAALALQRAGLKPVAPFGADDDALDVTNAYATGQAALLVADAHDALDWADLIYAMDLNGMNSSITPLGKPVQDARPYKSLNWDASRVLHMLEGSYLFQTDSHRIIQDPESLRASSIRQGSAWKAWAVLRDTLAIQLNSSDNNPAVSLGLSPEESWELATPQFMKYFVKGGPYSHGQHGYVLSNANWDPYPLANDVEAFVTALANMDVAVTLRIERFSSTFFTVVDARDAMPTAQRGFRASGAGGFTPVDIWQEIQSLSTPLVPEGQAIVATVEDLQAQTRIKLQRARKAVDVTMDLLAQDILTASYWMDVRKVQDPNRTFGLAPTAAWQALRKVVPLDPAARPNRPIGDVTAAWLKSTPAAAFYPAAQEELGGELPRPADPRSK
jgi:histidine ammonia-lyase